MKALLIVDVQNDFLPGGALEVPRGNAVLSIINNIQQYFRLIVATRDWHPVNHASFASNNYGKKIGEEIRLHGQIQILKPENCIQGSPGAEISPLLNQALINNVIFKGSDPDIDSYSAFYDNGHLKETGLHAYLKRNGISTIYVSGLGADYSIYNTIRDGILLGYDTFLVKDAICEDNLFANNANEVLTELIGLGAKIITSKDLA